MAQIAFTVARKAYQIKEHDGILAMELERRGHTVRPIVWGAHVPTHIDLIIFRAHWDYIEDPISFVAWLGQLSSSPKLLCANTCALITWNLHKRYLLELSRYGVPIPDCCWLDPSLDKAETASHETVLGQFLSQLRAQGESEVITKPAFGASGHGVTKRSLQQCLEWYQDSSEPYQPGGWIVQKWVPWIEQGEWSLIFFDGMFAEAVLKMPKKGEYRINTCYGGQVILATAKKHWIKQAEQWITLLPEVPVYARVDCVVDGNDTLILMEMELNEPSLFFSLLSPSSVQRAAEAIERVMER